MPEPKRHDASGLSGLSGTSSTNATSGGPGPIAHGGNLREAAQRYGIALDAWLDLSTGINPHGYPVPPVPASAWHRLPEDGDGLAACAARYYGAPDAQHVLPTAGSQAAIRALPALLAPGVTAVAALTYGEYAPAFLQAGHPIVPLDTTLETLPENVTHAVVANPNNPTATRVEPERLLGWHAQLAARGGTLIVDEAFADALDDPPSVSVAQHVGREGLVVLRSPGKFFGLAGARCGFALAQPARLDALRRRLGAWTVSGPARHAVTHALGDQTWQRETRARLAADGARLVALLERHGFAPRATPLFAWVVDRRAHMLHQALAQRAVWTRLFPTPASLRFGLPGSEAAWRQFETALAHSLSALSPDRQ
ncbi:threonine-phosphate decarboxylase [Burkholderia sp. WAC0059]|uniref:threonine-phosphate decarboxylase CobD n=1 Tax=Burkholderia sp. WAC0059 TaxID=2066022 RepID=UPI000C7F1D7F|nr:threonine-phosphate decarboxylase CobD [Burkholderia sp. WAC0059]PLZ00500.1 threonine-phosphate decarboxylase [Burkholderia sp. WAC0059]